MRQLGQKMINEERALVAEAAVEAAADMDKQNGILDSERSDPTFLPPTIIRSGQTGGSTSLLLPMPT